MSLTTGKILYHDLSFSSHWHIWQGTKMTVETTRSHPHWAGKQKTTKPQIKCDSKNCQIMEYGLIIIISYREGKEISKTDYCPVVEACFLKPDVNKSFTGSLHRQTGKWKWSTRRSYQTQRRRKKNKIICMFWTKNSNLIDDPCFRNSLKISIITIKYSHADAKPSSDDLKKFQPINPATRCFFFFFIRLPSYYELWMWLNTFFLLIRLLWISIQEVNVVNQPTWRETFQRKKLEESQTKLDGKSFLYRDVPTIRCDCVMRASEKERVISSKVTL